MLITISRYGLLQTGAGFIRLAVTKLYPALAISNLEQFDADMREISSLEFVDPETGATATVSLRWDSDKRTETAQIVLTLGVALYVGIALTGLSDILKQARGGASILSAIDEIEDGRDSMDKIKDLFRTASGRQLLGSALKFGFFFADLSVLGGTFLADLFLSEEEEELLLEDIDDKLAAIGIDPPGGFTDYYGIALPTSISEILLALFIERVIRILDALPFGLPFDDLTVANVITFITTFIVGVAEFSVSIDFPGLDLDLELPEIDVDRLVADQFWSSLDDLAADPWPILTTFGGLLALKATWSWILRPAITP